MLLWGAASGDFGPFTISAFTDYDATINSGAYVQLLKQQVMPHFTVSEPCQLIHSHSPVNQSRVVKNWINGQPEFYVVDFPRMSPDLSIIEYFWAKLVRELNQRTAIVSTRQQLFAESEQLLDELCTREYFSAQCLLMHSRYERVLELDGEVLPPT